MMKHIHGDESWLSHDLFHVTWSLSVISLSVHFTSYSLMICAAFLLALFSFLNVSTHREAVTGSGNMKNILYEGNIDRKHSSFPTTSMKEACFFTSLIGSHQRYITRVYPETQTVCTLIRPWLVFNFLDNRTVAESSTLHAGTSPSADVLLTQLSVSVSGALITARA